jgi:hypothetical protein
MGFNSHIYKDVLIVIENPIHDIPSIKKYYVRFHNKRIMVFNMINVADILLNYYTIESLAYVLSQKAISFQKDGVLVKISDDSLTVSSLININIFTSIKSICNDVDDKIIKCQLAIAEIIDTLKWEDRMRLFEQ